MKNVFTTMTQNVEPDDLDELHDVLVMLAQAVDKQEKEIKSLTKRMNRVNEALPSTAFPKIAIKK